MEPFRRSHLSILEKRLEEELRRFIQVIHGPRQVGKTTLVKQFVEKSALPSLIASADAVPAERLYYCRSRNDEVDFVVEHQEKVVGIEVISHAGKPTCGMAAFQKQFDPDRVLLVGGDGLP